MAEEEYSAAELKQIQRLNTLRKQVGLVMKRWGWLAVLAFLGTATLVTLYVLDRFQNAHDRFEASTRLLFTPRTVAKIETVDDRQLAQVLERNLMRARLGEKLNLSDAERRTLILDLTLEQSRRPSNLFYLSACAPTREGAIRKVNAYADLCIEEYVAYRLNDIGNWKVSVLQRRKDLLDALAELEVEESTLKTKTGVPAPVQALEAVNMALTDQRRALAVVTVNLANEELRCQKYTAALGGVPTDIVNHSAEIRRRAEEISKVDDEITELRKLYTDLNPKVVVKLDDRENLHRAYTNLLARAGVSGMGLELGALAGLEKSATALDEAKMKADLLRENKASIEQEIKDGEARAAQLLEVIPQFERLRLRREDMQHTLRELDETVNNIGYLENAAVNDLAQVERATGASERPPLKKKHLVLGLGMGGFMAVSVAFLCIFLELVYGKLRSVEELGFHPGIEVLGALPHGKVKDENVLHAVREGIGYRFRGAAASCKVVFQGAVRGSTQADGVNEVLDCTTALAGKTVLRVEIVSARDFVEPEGADMGAIVIRHGGRAWLPLSNIYALSPSELQLLACDMEALRKDFDLIYLERREPLRPGGVFLSQILELCDSMLLMAGVRKSRRTDLDFVLRLQESTERRLLVVATDVTEKEARKMEGMV